MKRIRARAQRLKAGGMRWETIGTLAAHECVPGRFAAHSTVLKSIRAGSYAT